MLVRNDVAGFFFSYFIWFWFFSHFIFQMSSLTVICTVLCTDSHRVVLCMPFCSMCIRKYTKTSILKSHTRLYYVSFYCMFRFSFNLQLCRMSSPNKTKQNKTFSIAVITFYMVNCTVFPTFFNRFVAFILNHSPFE